MSIVRGTEPVRALALELTKGCNLRCGYCYYAQREAAYDPSKVMSAEVARASVDRLIADGPPGQPLHLHFFGGEPLLAFKELEAAVEYALARGAETGRTFTFEVTTNGTRFTEEIIAFLDRHAVHVGVSFDGPPEVQDASRPAFGRSSWEMAAPGIRRFVGGRKGTPLIAKTHASMVVTRRDLDVLKLTRHVEDLGFEKIIVTFATDLEGENHGVGPEQMQDALAQIDRLAADYESRLTDGRPSPVTWFPRLVTRIGSGERRTSPCSGGLDYLGVAADGKVALCYRFFEDEGFSMGDIEDGITRDVTERLRASPLESREPCRSCWARYFCGGGCHHDNLESSGDVASPNIVACDIFRHSMDRALDIWGRTSRRRAATTQPAGSRSPSSMAESSSPFAPDARPTKKDSCHIRELDGERVVYEPVSHEVVILNATAAFIFELCDGHHTVADMTSRLARRFAAPPEVLERDLQSTLATFRTKSLLV